MSAATSDDTPRGIVVTPWWSWHRAITRTCHSDDTCAAGSCAEPFRPVFLAVVLVGSYADYKTGRNAHPGQAQVARMLGVSRATITRSLRWAVGHGWLGVAGLPGPSQATVYALTIPPVLVTVTGGSDV